MRFQDLKNDGALDDGPLRPVDIIRKARGADLCKEGGAMNHHRAMHHVDDEWESFR
jgi:hypothetical protein